MWPHSPNSGNLYGVALVSKQYFYPMPSLTSRELATSIRLRGKDCISLQGLLGLRLISSSSGPKQKPRAASSFRCRRHHEGTINCLHAYVRQISCQAPTALGLTSLSIFVAQSHLEGKIDCGTSLTRPAVCTASRPPGRMLRPWQGRPKLCARVYLSLAGNHCGSPHSPPSSVLQARNPTPRKEFIDKS
jgi:hypothetical protein